MQDLFLSNVLSSETSPHLLVPRRSQENGCLDLIGTNRRIGIAKYVTLLSNDEKNSLSSRSASGGFQKAGILDFKAPPPLLGNRPPGASAQLLLQHTTPCTLNPPFFFKRANLVAGAFEMDSPAPCPASSDGSGLVSESTFIAGVTIPSFICLVLGAFIYCAGRRQAKVTTSQKKENVKLERKYNDLKNWNKYLAENLKRQSMAVDDLNAMEEAMEELKKKGKKDELSEVIIDSHEVMVKGLLGKGGNGEVHIASYKGQEVALKQITQVRGCCHRLRFCGVILVCYY